jgi:hypothetical protein
VSHHVAGTEVVEHHLIHWSRLNRRLVNHQEHTGVFCSLYASVERLPTRPHVVRYFYADDFVGSLFDLCCR